MDVRATGGRTTSPVALLALALIVVLAACTNNPPPPVVNSSAVQTSTPAAEETSEIVVSLNGIGGGYNPHNLADSSTVTQALAQLLLPSVFRLTEDGTPELDENLMESAEVTAQEPFTVTYRIRPDASWSDGAPIAVEDFVYLTDAMKTEPGVVDPAGYRLITDIRPGDGGKQVEVVFREPYPGWKSLFDNLLPAHLLKDVPGGWARALDDSFPAYGGPFAVKTMDHGRGEIVLERNERYWEKPAAVDQIVLHRADQQDTIAALRSGNSQFALGGTDEAGLTLFQELGEDVELHHVARPYVAQILLRPAGPALADDQVRAGVVALIDRNRLIEAGTRGGPAASAPAGAQVLAPSAEDYESTIPSGAALSADPKKAEQLLNEAGYTRQAGSWVDEDGDRLSLVVATPGKREPYARIASELSEQLIAAGVEVTTVDPPPRELFSGLLAEPVNISEDGERTPTQTGQVTVDIVVAPRPVNSVDPASTLASAFGCGLDADSLAAASGPQVPANPAAFCAEELQSEIESMLTGELSLAEGLSTLEPKLWERNIALPLFQLTDLLVIGSGVSGVHPGPPMAGPFSSAVNWTRAPR